MATNTPTEIDTLTAPQFKIYENCLRRAAHRQGLRLQKCRARDRRHHTFATYQLIDLYTSAIVYADHRTGYGLDVHEVAKYLSGETD